MKSLFSNLEQHLQTFPSSVSVLKVIREWPFFKYSDRYSFFLTIEHNLFWVSEEWKELSPSQILYNELEKYLSLSIYKNLYFIRIKFRFFNGK